MNTAKQTQLLNSGNAHQPYFHFLAWWLVVLCFGFCLYVAHDLGYLEMIYARDRSYLTMVISLLVVVATAHAFYHVVQKSHYLESNNSTLMEDARLPVSVDTQSAELQQLDQSALIEVLAAHLRSAVELGWFLVDLAIRLGLAGTIVGFILIFSSLSGEAIVGENALRELLVSMSGGMGTALFTTLSGLVAATFLSLQYLILSRLTDRLIAKLLLSAPNNDSRESNESSAAVA